MLNRLSMAEWAPRLCARTPLRWELQAQERFQGLLATDAAFRVPGVIRQVPHRIASYHIVSYHSIA